ncbi:MAG TPA: hemolysin family protein [Acidimicrobiales bacterium]|nr:hemolysin family protein [Acidimicrobiales bacterium]
MAGTAHVLAVGTADAWAGVAAIACLVAAGLLAAAEAALTRVTRPRAEAMADEGRRGSEDLLQLVRQPAGAVTTVAFLRIAAELVQATLVGVVANRALGPAGAALVVAADVAVTFVVSESVPRTWAMLNVEGTALAVARPVRALAAVTPLRGIARGLVGVTNALLPGKGLQHGPFVSPEEELLAVAEIGVEEGVIEEGERDLIESIIEFGDTLVREVMVPRPDMVTVADHFRVADVMEVFLLNGYSRLPVCGRDLDDVVGLAYAKDLMGAERDGKADVPIRELVRPARFVPETKRAPELLREMQQDKIHMAIVVDEYGGTAGLVTLEDVIEELVGEIADEFDIDDPLVEPLPGGGARVPGRMPLDQVNDLLQARLPEGDWDTVGGLVYDRLGHVPVEGEVVHAAGWQLTAQRIQGRRIGRVRIVPDDAAPEPPTDPTERPPPHGHAGTRPTGTGPPTGPASPGPAGGTHGTGPPPSPAGGPAQPRRGHRLAGDDGLAGGVEALPFGLLVFVVGTLLVANAWAVVDAKLAVDAAARQATRAYVEAEVPDGDGADGAEATAVAAGLAALDAHGRDPAKAWVGLGGLEGSGGQQGFSRCARATFVARYEVPALTLPWIGGFGRGIDVTSRHSEIVDPYRSGVPGSAESCGA